MPFYLRILCLQCPPQLLLKITSKERNYVSLTVEEMSCNIGTQREKQPQDQFWCTHSPIKVWNKMLFPNVLLLYRNQRSSKEVCAKFIFGSNPERKQIHYLTHQHFFFFEWNKIFQFSKALQKEKLKVRVRKRKLWNSGCCGWNCFLTF